MAGGQEQSGDGWEQLEAMETPLSTQIIVRQKKIQEATFDSSLHKQWKQWNPPTLRSFDNNLKANMLFDMILFDAIRCYSIVQR